MNIIDPIIFHLCGLADRIGAYRIASTLAGLAHRREMSRLPPCGARVVITSRRGQ